MPFVSCVTNQQKNQKDVLTKKITGTTWAGTDSDGDYYEFYFLSDGKFNYQAPSGFWENGKWKVTGKTIYMEMNDKYCEYQGEIGRKQMKGNAWNVEGRRWTWLLEKK